MVASQLTELVCWLVGELIPEPELFMHGSMADSDDGLMGALERDRWRGRTSDVNANAVFRRSGRRMLIILRPDPTGSLDLNDNKGT